MEPKIEAQVDIATIAFLGCNANIEVEVMAGDVQDVQRTRPRALESHGRLTISQIR